jgi:hypothetical protein
MTNHIPFTPEDTIHNMMATQSSNCEKPMISPIYSGHLEKIPPEEFRRTLSIRTVLIIAPLKTIFSFPQDVFAVNDSKNKKTEHDRNN